MSILSCLPRKLRASIVLILFHPLSVTSQISEIRQDFIDYGFPRFEDCQMDIMFGGRVKFENLQEDISRAKHFIHIEYYKWYNDSVGRRILDALAERASQGVQVRVLYDAYGNRPKNSSLTEDIIDSYRSKGVKLVAFDPMRFPYINHALHRMHRKMVIIDGRMVYTGGLNVADYYIHGSPKYGNWSDVHARITGPIVNAYQDLFADMWHKETGEYLPPHYSSNLEQSGFPDEGYEAFVVDREPGNKSARIRESYISCLSRAKKSVRIINPYIILVTSVRKALRQCIARGVDVEILLGYHGDNVVSEVSTAREVYSLARRGAKVWLCKECFHHDKLMMVDDTLSVIGTANLDARSLSFDYEVNACFFSPEHTSQLNAYFDNHVKSSVRLTEHNWTSLYPRNKRRLGWWLKGIRGLL